MWVNFGDIARKEIGMQAQYASRFVGGFKDIPNLSDGIRFFGDRCQYHNLMIWSEDVTEFVHRVRDYEKNNEKV